MASTEVLEHRLRTRLAELEAQGLRRYLRPPSGIDLCSNDYLGLATHPFLKQRMAEAVLREGCGSTGSRLLRGERECFSAVERRFAEFKNTPAALYFGSGYAANLSVLTSFPEETDVIFSDERNHASLIDGIRLARARRVVFPHNDVRTLGSMVRSETGAGQKFLVTESIFSMDGDAAPLASYAKLCRETNTALIVDEAHAVGIYGRRGSGMIEAESIESDVFVSINTAGKALGVSGAFVSGSANAIEYLVQRARPFIFSTAPPPAVAAALDVSLTIVAAESSRRDLLSSRSLYLRTALEDAGIDVPRGFSPIVPIVLGSNERAMAAAAALQAEGLDVRAIRPPTVAPGTSRLRVSVNVNVREADLDRLVSILAATLARLAA